MLFFLIPATFLEPQVLCSWLVTSPCAVGVYPQPAIPLATPCPWMRRGAGAALRKVWRAGCHNLAAGFFRETILSCRGQLEVRVSCCLE